MFAFAILLSLILLILGTPIFLVFGLGSSIAAVWGLNLPWSTLIQVSFGAMTKHILIAVTYRGKGLSALVPIKVCLDKMKTQKG